MNKLHTSHSSIPSYPPNVLEYPNFYNSKEYVYILKPGDMLYIPPKWFHWVFSYPDEQQNIAMSYTMVKYNNIYNEFQFNKPFKFHLDKNEHPFFNYNLDSFKNMYPTNKITTLISNKNTLIPVKKSSLDKSHQLQKLPLTFSEMEDLHKTNTYNLYMGQNYKLDSQKPPDCILNSFPDSVIRCSHWLALLNKDTEYIESGLHYDLDPNTLIQIKGTKLVRLFRPQEYNNLYVQPMYTI
jgi:hypothetical protein